MRHDPCVDFFIFLLPVVGDRLGFLFGRRGDGEIDQGNALLDHLAVNGVLPVGVPVVVGLD